MCNCIKCRMVEALIDAGATAFKLSDEANEINNSLEDWLNMGWTPEQMEEKGYLVPVTGDKKITHKELVHNLVKDGQDIINDLTPTSAHLWHMATGLAGEVGELVEWHLDDTGVDNLIEELGDIEFFYQAIATELDITVNGDGRSVLQTHFSTDYILLELTRHANNLLDLVKKQAVYAGEVKYPEMVSSMQLVRRFLNHLYSTIDFTRECVIEANIEKLTARFPDGAYTNKSAQERADKTEK